MERELISPLLTLYNLKKCKASVNFNNFIARFVNETKCYQIDIFSCECQNAYFLI